MASNSRWAINIKNASTGNTVYNNILFNENYAHGSITIAADSLDHFTSDYNTVDGHFSPNDEDMVKLPAWQSQTGQDQHSIIADPANLFVNADKGDYRLCVSSPAIGIGTSLPSPRQAPATDISGTARPANNKWDLGAYLPTNLQPMGTVHAIHHVRRYLAGLFGFFCIVALGGAGGIHVIRNRGLHRWMGSYLLQTGKRRPAPTNEAVHVLLCIADHFEPGNGGVGEDRRRPASSGGSSVIRLYSATSETTTASLPGIHSSFRSSNTIRFILMLSLPSAAPASARLKSICITTRTTRKTSARPCCITNTCSHRDRDCSRATARPASLLTHSFTAIGRSIIPTRTAKGAASTTNLISCVRRAAMRISRFRLRPVCARHEKSTASTMPLMIHRNPNPITPAWMSVRRQPRKRH